MKYEDAMAGGTPKTLEEALEKAFWRASGKGLLGVGLPETWQAVARTARAFIKYADWDERGKT